MSEEPPIKRALISVSDKTDLVAFARGLSELGVELISTGGTAAALRGAGLAVTTVDEVTGFPEMLDGRVKTLHPVIHGGLLARRDAPAHVQALREQGIEPIDLVCVNLYPFEQTILVDGVTRAEAIEQIDIGGPTLIRSAAKNHDFVTVVTAAGQYDRVISEMQAHDGATTAGLRRELAAAAFRRTADYDTAISAWMGEGRQQTARGFPDLLRLDLAKVGDLRYGENPHQRAAVYRDRHASEGGVVTARLRHGKPLSYNNLHDAAAARHLIVDLHDGFEAMAAAAIIKHTNPCGAAVAEQPAAAFDGAWAGDPLAAFGGVLAVSTAIDAALAERILDGKRFLEVILAPGFDDAAVAGLGARWPDVRLLQVQPPGEEPSRGLEYRSVPGGMLVQDRDRKPASPAHWMHAAGPAPDHGTMQDAAFAWTVVKHVKSNAVVVAGGGRLLGSGPGQVDRVGAARLAVTKAGSALAERRARGEPVVAASDAFFPFPDGPEVLIDAGVTCIVQPGGSRRDQETIELCEARGVTCLLTGVRHFRH